MFKEYFPFFTHNPGIIYMDSAATSQTLYTVIEDQNDFNINHKSNAHRSGHRMGAWVDNKYHIAKEQIGKYLGIDNPHKRVIFTSGSSAGLADAVAMIKQQHGYATFYLGIDSHHSMILPIFESLIYNRWPMPITDQNFNLKYIDIDHDGSIDLTSIENDFAKDNGIKILAVSAISNVLGIVNDLEKIKSFAKKYNAITILDASQIVGKRKVNLDGFDFVSFSWHKVYGPTGLGTLIIDEKWLSNKPVRPGGGTITSVAIDGVKYLDNAAKFESGTQNLSAIVTIPRLVQWLIDHDTELEGHDIALAQIANYHVNIKQFQKISESQSSLISLAPRKGASEDYAYMLDAYDIMIRSGKLCAEPLMNKVTNQSGLIRLSWGCYTPSHDIELTFDMLGKIYGKL